MEKTFLHVTCWPVYRHEGRLHTWDLWRKDLEFYFDYLDRIVLFSPVEDRPAPPTASAIRQDLAERIELVHTPNIVSGWLKLKNTIPHLIGLARQLRRADVVQVILIENPIVYGFLFAFLRRFTKIRTVVFVESSGWRRPGVVGWKSLYWRFCERMAAVAVRNATLSMHTQEEYRKSLGGVEGTSFVVPAVWIEESDLATSESLEALLEARSPSGRIRLGYFGQMVHDKGLDVLIEAVGLCRAKGLDVELDAYGTGPKLADFMERASKVGGVRFPGMLKYGREFLGRLATYDVTVVPSRSNEHLRITVDSCSQGVPLLVSDVPGLRQIAQDGVNGMVVPKEDPAALAAAIERLAADRDLRGVLSRGALRSVAGMSHRKMHQLRAELLRRVVPDHPHLLAPRD